MHEMKRIVVKNVKSNIIRFMNTGHWSTFKMLLVWSLVVDVDAPLRCDEFYRF